MFLKRDNFTLAFGLWFQFWLVLITLAGASMAIICSYLDRSGRTTQLMARWWARALLYMGRVPVQVEGLEYLKPGQTYVFAANHRSNFDIYILLASLPGNFGFIAKKELFQIPLFGQAIDKLGCVPVDRQNIQDAIRCLNQAAAKVKRGASMAIFPEGTRVAAAELAPFKKGVFIMAQRAGQPVVPVAINGTRFIQPRGTVRVRPGAVQVVVRPPISPQSYRRKDDLMNAVRLSLQVGYDPDYPYQAGGKGEEGKRGKGEAGKK